jgi:hypothetical protein
MWSAWQKEEEEEEEEEESRGGDGGMPSASGRQTHFVGAAAFECCFVTKTLYV